ncbi:MAG: xylulokinase [Treponema sp.]|jgi:xylulokinase|nr:xylulokinase [Treponema sp.]
MNTVAGIDLGTQSCKVILYDYENKKLVAWSQVPIDMIADNEGTREQKAEWYQTAISQCFAELAPELKKTIRALGVSGHQHSLVPLDAENKAVYNVKLWCDTSTATECLLLTAAAGGEQNLIVESGLPMRPGYTAPKVLWLKNNKPEAFEKLAHILLPHDYINFLLTGKYTAEAGDASGTALFNIRTRKWSEQVCTLIDRKVLECLPQIIAPGSPAGEVSDIAAQAYGIPKGAIVATGSGDNMISAIGTGTVTDGFLTMSLGTSGTLFGFSATPIIDPLGDLAAFCSSSGGWLPLLCTMNCTVASEEFRKLFALDVRSFDNEAAKAPIGADGIVVLPFFNGERTPNLPNGRASVTGITAANFKRENIARAALESVIFGMRIGYDRFNHVGFKAQEIRLTGGAAKSPLLQELAANIMNLPVHLPANDESGALGAAIQALWTLTKEPLESLVAKHVILTQTIEPKTEAVKRYDEAYGEYSKYLEKLQSLYS